jgi:hypothetical protein
VTILIEEQKAEDNNIRNIQFEIAIIYADKLMC